MVNVTSEMQSLKLSQKQRSYLITSFAMKLLYYFINVNIFKILLFKRQERRVNFTLKLVSITSGNKRKILVPRVKCNIKLKLL